MAVSGLSDCVEVREFLADFLEKKLAFSQSLLFRLHLFMCPPCARYLRRYKADIKRWQSLGAEPPPPELVELTMKFLDKHLDKTGAAAPSRDSTS